MDVIRENVRQIKLQKSLDVSCQGSYGFNLESSVVDTAEEQLKTNSSDERFNNMTAEDLKTAAEMFIYLNMCPEAIKSWIVFYKEIFENESPDQMILTLNRMMKGTRTPQNEFFKQLAETLFKRVTSLFSLQGKQRNTSEPFPDLKITNHPVHIKLKNNQQSPSAFIPFCEFGGNMSAMGVKIDQFDIPVCSCFQARILNDQLCYEVDLNKYAKKDNIDKNLELGFNFLMDYNEDRQVSFHQDMEKKTFGLASNIIESDQSSHAFIYLNTIGKTMQCISNSLEC